MSDTENTKNTITVVKEEVQEAVADIKAVVAEVDTLEEGLDAVNKVETILQETLVDLSGTPIPALLQTMVAQVGEFSSQSAILRFVAPLAAAVHGLTVPGAQKKALVLKGLHEFTAELEKAGKISSEMKESVDIFVDGAGPVAIDAILDVAKGKVEFTPEQATQVAVTVASAGCAACFAYFLKSKK
jgi:hypothetical protein